MKYLGSEFDLSGAKQKGLARNVRIISLSDISLDLSDGGQIIQANGLSPQTITIPTHATTPHPIGTRIDIVRTGTANVFFDPVSGVQLYTKDGYHTIGQRWGMATLFKLGTNEWILSGELSEDVTESIMSTSDYWWDKSNVTTSATSWSDQNFSATMVMNGAVAGVASTGFNFPGADVDHATLPTPAKYAGTGTTGSFSFIMVATFDTFTAGDRFYSSEPSGSAGFRLSYSGGLQAALNGTASTTAIAMSTGVKHGIGFTISDGTLTAFVNGAARQTASIAGFGGSTPTSAGPRIGGGAWLNAVTMDGLVEAVVIDTNKAFTLTEINEVMTAYSLSSVT